MMKPPSISETIEDDDEEFVDLQSTDWYQQMEKEMGLVTKRHKLTLPSLEATHEMGHWIAQQLMPSCVVLLSGDLGAGKTTLSKGICEALGVPPRMVTSPTYTIVNIYPGKWPIHHVDLYRMRSAEELEAMDRDEIISEDGITLVEWPQRGMDTLLEEEAQLHLKLTVLNEASRELEITSPSPAFQSIFDELKHYAPTVHR